MAVLQSINYYLRPGKNVVRKLLFECFRRLGKVFDIPSYRYVGLGSIWFIDFILAHKILHIQDLVSIEQDKKTCTRARFNKPFACVSVEFGSSTLVLPDLEIDQKPHLIWMDYTNGVEGPVIPDVKIICGKSKSGTILALTINAHVGILRNAAESEDPDDQELLETLRDFAGEATPATVSPITFTTKGYPKLVAEVLFNHMEHATRSASGNDRKFVPLLNLLYKDSAPMVVVVGIITDQADDTIEKSDVWELFQVQGREQVEVGVPVLTVKEKAALDQLLPDDELNSATIQNEYDFVLAQREVEAYRRFYRYYPIYFEATL